MASLRAVSLSTVSGKPVVAVLHGMGRVRKTATAVHLAHEAAAAFTDGQYYVDLRGFHPWSGALDPADALDLLLRAADYRRKPYYATWAVGRTDGGNVPHTSACC
jgi:hypothetical protein